MRIAIPIKCAATVDRLVRRAEVMDALNIQSHERVVRLIERGQLPKPVEIGNQKQFRLSELAAMYPGIFEVAK